MLYKQINFKSISKCIKANTEIRVYGKRYNVSIMRIYTITFWSNLNKMSNSTSANNFKSYLGLIGI